MEIKIAYCIPALHCIQFGPLPGRPNLTMCHVLCSVLLDKSLSTIPWSSPVVPEHQTKSYMSSRTMQAVLPHPAPATWQQVGKGQPVSVKLRKEVVSMSKKHRMFLTGTAQGEDVSKLLIQVSSVQLTEKQWVQDLPPLTEPFPLSG